jgi:hypothetical protein
MEPTFLAHGGVLDTLLAEQVATIALGDRRLGSRGG